MFTHPIRISLILLLLAAPFVVVAQQGYSSASMSMGKMRAASRSIPVPDEVVIEEYVNYHKHQIPRPAEGERVALSLQWGNPRLSDSPSESILQVGIATGKAASVSLLPPVNVALVIDKSGSMAGDRIRRAREAAHAFLDRLRPGDIFSVVAFDHTVEVVVPAAPIVDKGPLHRAIDRIRDEGSTNLDLGMLTGYEQLVRHQRRGQTNRIIMLTDALTNTGITDPMEMVRHSQLYTEDFEVDFTIVGVGVDFNQGLSRQLTGSSRSSIFFVNDAADIQKVFIDEVESLLSAVGRDVVLEITLPKGVQASEIYGYSPTMTDRTIRIPLENLNGDLTMVVMLRLGNINALQKEFGSIQASLRYFDIEKGNHHSVRATGAFSDWKYDWAGTLEVDKNYQIALMASALKEMATLASSGKMNEAAIPINRALDRLNREFPELKDKDLIRVADILKRYAGELETALAN